MITPSLNGQVLYDDNIYLKNGADNLANKKESDWIYHVMPGIMLNYNIRKEAASIWAIRRLGFL